MRVVVDYVYKRTEKPEQSNQRRLFMTSAKRVLWIPIFFTLILAIGIGNPDAYAANTPAKGEQGADWKFHTIVGVDVVRQYAKVPQPEGVMIIDSRPYKPKYIKGHIPTAVSIPDSQFEKMTNLLPKDKNTTLIIYCGGVK
jgi:hypothetical protein